MCTGTSGAPRGSRQAFVDSASLSHGAPPSMSDPIDQKLAINLRRWLESRQPHQWCAEHNGAWNDDAWNALLASLWWSDYWPMDEGAIRSLVEDLLRPSNLLRWKESGQ